MKFMVSFNTDPLVAPLTPQEISALKQRRGRGDFGPMTPFWRLVGAVVVVVFMVVAITFAITFNIWGALATMTTYGHPLHFITVLPPLQEGKSDG